MRKILLVFAVCVCSAVFAENIVLDLSNPGDFPIEYDETGLWADVFNNDSIVYSQEFMFSHASPYRQVPMINGAVWLREALPERELPI